MLMNVLYIVSGVLAGVVVALKAIVPRIHSPRLEAVETRLEQLESLVVKVLPPEPPAPPA